MVPDKYVSYKHSLKESNEFEVESNVDSICMPVLVSAFHKQYKWLLLMDYGIAQSGYNA